MKAIKLRVSTPIRAIIFIAFVTAILFAITSCSSNSELESTPLPEPVNEPKPLGYCLDFLELEEELNQPRLDTWKTKEINCEGKVIEIEGTIVRFRIERELAPDDFAECEFTKVSDLYYLNEGSRAPFTGKFGEFSTGFSLRKTVKFKDCQEYTPPSN